jgi:hypothetical protein
MIVLRIPTLTHFNVRALEWGASAIMLTVGILLFDPYPTLDQPSFTSVREWGNDIQWGTVMCGLAVARLIALWRNGAWEPSPYIRIFGALVSACIWALLCMNLSKENPAFILGAFLAWGVVADIYSAGRAGKDARLSRDARLKKPEAPRMIVA